MKTTAAVTAGAMAVFMANLDITVVNIALPTLCRIYGVDATEVAAVVLTYMLALTGTLLVFGRLSDALGVEPVFLYGFGIFTAGSVLCGVAPGFYWLVLFRFLQGIGGAMVYATAAVVIAKYVPADRRGRAFSVIGLCAGCALACGSPLGGYLVHDIGWRWIFLINLPIGIAGYLLGRYAFRKTPPRAASGRMDWVGGALNLLALASLTYALHEGQSRGWTSPVILTCFAGAVVIGAFFLLQERRARDPLLNLALFRNLPLLAAIVSNSGYLLSLMGLSFLLPFYLQIVRTLPPDWAGMFMAIFPAMSIIVSPAAGYLADRYGPRPVCILGAALVLAASGGFVLIGQDTPFLWIAVVEVVLGSGMGLYLTSVLTLIMSHANRGNAGMVNALRLLVPNMAALVGMTLFAFVYDQPIHAHHVHGQADGAQWVMIGFRAGIALVCTFSVLTFGSALLARHCKGNVDAVSVARKDYWEHFNLKTAVGRTKAWMCPPSVRRWKRKPCHPSGEMRRS